MSCFLRFLPFAAMVVIQPHKPREACLWLGVSLEKGSVGNAEPPRSLTIHVFLGLTYRTPVIAGSLCTLTTTLQT